MILEFNKYDKHYIKNNDNFTISPEIELETSDNKGKENIDKATFLEIILNSLKKFIESQSENKDKYLKKVKEILTQLHLEDDYYNDYNEQLLFQLIENTEGFEKDLYRVLYSDYITYWESDNIDYLTEMVKKYLPNFHKKWNDILKFELDNTLDRGIEFSPKLYLNGIDQIVEYIEDFYSDYNNQNYWKFTDKTSIHINVGVDNAVEWNIFKGVLMISDNKDSYIFKDMGWRKKSLYAKSFLPKLKKDLKEGREKIMNIVQFKDLKRLEKDFSQYILKKLDEWGYKNYGFNITKIKNEKYVEFRYPGGEIEKRVLIEKIHYFCYIVKLMTEPDFKRREYLKTLYKFISNI